MKVILLENVATLGKMGATVNVSCGYARNYLIPNELAAEANEKNVKQLEHFKKKIEQKKLKELKDADALIQKIGSLSCTIARKVTEEEDVLYGSVSSVDIQKVLKDEGIIVEKGQITLAEPIKKLGVYNIPVCIFKDKTAELKIWVVKE